MPAPPPRQQPLDRITRIDELLEQILRLSTQPKETVVSFYPFQDKKSLPVGKTHIDMREGSVSFSDGSSSDSLSLAIPDDICRSLLINVDAKVIVTLRKGTSVFQSSSIYPKGLRVTNTSFDSLDITTTKKTLL